MLSVAASDPTGGAGVQADLKAIEASGGYAVTVLTAVTSQNGSGLQAVHPLDVEVVRSQLDELLREIEPAAVKCGALAGPRIVELLAERLERRPDLPLVVDPVGASTGGVPLNRPETLDAIVERLFPRTSLLTPNVEEVRELTGLKVRGEVEALRAGERIREMGCRAVLVKGGHYGERQAVDLLVDTEGAERFAAPRIDSPHTHGTGCVLASAIATGLARGEPLREAVRRAKSLIQGSIEHALSLGGPRGSVDPLHRLHRSAEESPA